MATLPRSSGERAFDRRPSAPRTDGEHRADAPRRLSRRVVTIADTAECGCPDWCNRDHDNE